MGKLVYLILTMKTMDHFKSKPLTLTPHNITHHGAVLLQTLLTYQKSLTIVTSYLSLTTDDILTLVQHTAGSHCVEKLFTSAAVKAKRKTQLLDKIQGDLHTVACNTYGSRVLEAIWRSSNIQMKTDIAKLLGPHSRTLSTDRFGKFVFRNFSLQQFNQNQEKWKEGQLQQARKRKALDEFVFQNVTR